MGINETGQQVKGNKEEVAKQLSGIISLLVDRDVGLLPADIELEGEVGLDSIHRVELSTRISALYGISVGVDELDAMDTFGELVDTVVAAGSGSPTNSAS